MTWTHRLWFWSAGTLSLILSLFGGSAARAETVTFTAAGRVTFSGQGALVPTGTPYGLTFTLNLLPPPTSGSGLWAYTRTYDLLGYTAHLGSSEISGAGRVSLVHRPLGRDRVIIWGDNGDVLLRLTESSAGTFLSGKVGPPALKRLTSSVPFASAASVPPSTPLVGTFESSADGVTGRVDQIALAPAQLVTVPAPSAAWAGLALLGALGAANIRRRRGEQLA